MEGSALFVVGGQEYYGETAKRDAEVTKLIGRNLSPKRVAKVITGGMPGIPEDMAKEFQGKVLCVVSEPEKEKFIARDTGFEFIVAGETQLKRRLFVTQMPEIACALVIQGGKYSTHELKLLQERGIPIVSFWGSGGAAGGGQPYEEWTFTTKPEQSPLLCSTDPQEDPKAIAQAILEEIYKYF